MVKTGPGIFSGELRPEIFIRSSPDAGPLSRDSERPAIPGSGTKIIYGHKMVIRFYVAILASFSPHYTGLAPVVEKNQSIKRILTNCSTRIVTKKV
jgi:hypothetical protein